MGALVAFPMVHPADSKRRPRILVVDDEEMNLELLERSLQRKYEVVTARGAELALEILQQDSDVAIILCDYRMPGMNGTQFLAEAIKHNSQAKRVIITGYADVDSMMEAINRGQIHYFVKKPWNHQELDRSMEHLMQMHMLEDENRQLVAEMHRKNEELSNKEQLLAENLNDRGRDLLSANSELDRVNNELAILSYRDSLTGLYNHRTFHARLREEMARARRYRKELSLLFIDIDHFKVLNDMCGHHLGDQIICRIADLLRGGDPRVSSRESDVVARYGGEEFVLLLPETPKGGAKIKAERICQAIRETVFPDAARVTASVGVAAYPDDAAASEELIAFADHALYVAKHGGRDQVQVYGEGTAKPGTMASEPLADIVGQPDMGPSAYIESSYREAFPNHHDMINELAAELDRSRSLACLYVDLSRLRRVEFEYGVDHHTDLMNRIGALLVKLRGRHVRANDLLCRADDGAAFVYFLSLARRDGTHPPEELEQVSLRVQESIDKEFHQEVFDLIHDHPRVAVGYGRILHNPMVRCERLITRLIEDSKDSASLIRRHQSQRDKDALQEIILGSGLTPVYQPIVHLDSGEIFGFEALTRGPRTSPLETPLALFGVAKEFNLMFELDRACFRGAMRGAVGLEPVHRLFVNLLPLSFYDANFIENEILKLLDAARLTPANVVFEITEQLAIENFGSFRRALQVYTDLGFGIAIDDVGTKHSNLEAVMSLRPNFVKLSEVLTRGAAKSTVKREMLRSLGRISETIDAVIVGEGIETPEDLAVLKDLGVRYGQGYFLARPGPAFPGLSDSVKKVVGNLASGATAPVFSEEELDEHGEFRARPSDVVTSRATDPTADLVAQGSKGDLPN